MTRLPGNTLAEYLLIGVSIAILTIGALTLFGNNFNLMANALEKDLLGSYAGWHGSGANEDPSSYKVNMPVSLSDGTTLQVPVSPQFKRYVETTGINGNALLLAVVNELMRDYQKEGRISKQQADLMLLLANQGHSIAEIQTLMERNARKISDSHAFLDSSVLFNGRYFQMGDLSRQLDKEGGDSAVSSMMSLTSQLNSQISDSLLRALINDLSRQIQTSADTYSILTHQIASGEHDPRVIANSNASEDTHKMSKGICQSSGKRDTGNYCYGD